MNGAFVAFLNASIDRASLQMARNFTSKATTSVLTRAGLGADELAQWATVQGGEEQGWKGLWIPFKHRSPQTSNDPHQQQQALEQEQEQEQQPVTDENQANARGFHPGQEGAGDLLILHGNEECL